MYESAGRFDRSIPLYEEVLLPRARAKLGDANLTTLSLAASLGSNYRDAGRVGDGARVFDEWLPRARAHATHPTELGRYLLPAAETYRKAGKPDRAAELEAEALDIARKHLSSGDYRLLAGCGRVLLRDGKPAEAEPILRAGLGVLEKAGPRFLARLWETAGARALLGGALLGQRKYEEAEPLLLAGYAGLKEREKALPPPDKGRLPQASDWLVELYTALGKPDEAAKWRADRAKYDPAVAPPPREK